MLKVIISWIYSQGVDMGFENDKIEEENVQSSTKLDQISQEELPDPPKIQRYREGILSLLSSE